MSTAEGWKLRGRSRNTAAILFLDHVFHSVRGGDWSCRALTPGRYYVSASSFSALLICLSRYLCALRQREVCVVLSTARRPVCNCNLEMRGGTTAALKYGVHVTFHHRPRSNRWYFFFYAEFRARIYANFYQNDKIGWKRTNKQQRVWHGVAACFPHFSKRAIFFPFFFF